MPDVSYILTVICVVISAISAFSSWKNKKTNKSFVEEFSDQLKSTSTKIEQVEEAVKTISTNVEETVKTIKENVEKTSIKTEAISKRTDSIPELFFSKFLEQVRAIGEPNVHIHDIEVIGKRVLKEL